MEQQQENFEKSLKGLADQHREMVALLEKQFLQQKQQLLRGEEWPNERADSRFAPSQWETALPCNNVSHWPGANLESALSEVVTDMSHGRCGWNFNCVICWYRIVNVVIMNATTPHWWSVNSGAGNGLVPSGTKPLPDPMWSSSVTPICHS